MSHDLEDVMSHIAESLYYIKQELSGIREVLTTPTITPDTTRPYKGDDSPTDDTPGDDGK